MKVSGLVKVFVMFFRYGLYYINISKSPIYLTRDGYVDMTTGSLRDAGVSGDYWASPAYPSELYAYDLDFYSANVVPSGSNDRWYGFTVWTKTFFQSSIYLTRSGGIYLDSGSLRTTGRNGLYMARTADTSAERMYESWFYDMSLFPASDALRWIGFAVQPKLKSKQPPNRKAHPAIVVS